MSTASDDDDYVPGNGKAARPRANADQYISVTEIRIPVAAAAAAAADGNISGPSAETTIDRYELRVCFFSFSF